MNQQYSMDDLINTVEEFIPMLLMFFTMFVFIILVYRSIGKKKELYWFTLMTLFIFDLATIGISVDYLSAVAYGFSFCDGDVLD